MAKNKQVIARNNVIDKSADNANVKNRKKSSKVQKINWDENSVFKENKYYLAIAKKYAVLKYVTIVLTVVFGVFMLTKYSSKITAESFQYLFKDLDFGELTVVGNFEKLYYNSGTNSKYAIYRDELVVANAGMTTLYNSTGATSFSGSNTFYSPRIAVSDKYMLIYDRGNTTNSYSLYNSFSELKTQKLSYPISLADVSDSGIYAIVTRDETYRGCVLIYDDDFNLINEIRKDKYVTGIDLSDDGKNLVMSSLYDDDGTYVTEISCIIPGKDGETACITESGVTALKVQICADGNIILMCTDRIITYDSSLNKLSSVLLSEYSSVRSSLGKKAFCISYNKTVVGNDRIVDIYDHNGNHKITTEVSGELLSIEINEDYVYLLFEDHLQRIGINGDSSLSVKIDTNAIDLLFSSTGLPLICYAGYADPIVFGDEAVEDVSSGVDAD